jgi:xylulokinase
MLAAVACGEYKNVEEAADKIVKIRESIEPDPALVTKYNERYAKFKEIYPACKPLFELIKY